VLHALSFLPDFLALGLVADFFGLGLVRDFLGLGLMPDFRTFFVNSRLGAHALRLLAKAARHKIYFASELMRFCCQRR
jgi:hypothetical protein